MSIIRWHPEAFFDLNESIAFHARCDAGLGARFLNHADAAVARAAGAPTLHRCFDGPFRKAHVEVFPFAVIYRALDDGIQIIALMHGSRNPGCWKNHLEV